ncbi:MAG: GNAT family N-acetyltransferase [Euryarchaeota archaeon]|nr:GNAT family N-acetyltransferase [Euryarchaeota archaeon]MBU4608949.1 GNAT family N-acetyltransferase [Euryarchaeota archaeon]MBV1729263.1 GNAT family N-acetyltransferase [Methanobacterium sp.]MBV1756155.1 GNAT family N-acetyltransferase [Methanobacterium sp.]
MNINPQDEEVLLYLDVKAQKEFLPTVLKVVKDVSLILGFDKKTTRGLVLATEEACSNVIEHAYGPDEEGRYQVEIKRKPGKMVVKVKDQGIPFNLGLLNQDEMQQIGFRLMKAYSDDVKSKYRGKNGKEVKIIKYVPVESVDKTGLNDTREEVAPSSEEVTLRIMKPSDAVDLARCIYRVYGYTYPHEAVYYPELFASLVESGLVTSCIALNQAGEVVGHLGVFIDEAEDRVGESALAVVDPRYRGRGLFPRMKKMMMAEVKARGFKGLYSRAVTVHEASQRANVKMGAAETGFILAHSPPTAIFKKMTTKKDHLRRTVALFYIGVGLDEIQEVYLPLQHAEILKKIYKHAGLNRVYKKVVKERVYTDSLIHIHVIPETSSAFLRVERYGESFLKELALKVQDLCQHKIELIVLDLPLTDPVTGWMCAEIEKMGFFFSGLMPEYLKGDALRLEYLNNVPFYPDTVDVYSDFGKELFCYVVGEWQTHQKFL